MNSKFYKTCAVPQCKSTTIKTPSKLFIHVPQHDIRKKWLQLAGRDPTTSLISRMYFCEDHFDLPNCMENYIQYCIMGHVSKIMMKPGCLPTKFLCQSDRTGQTSLPPPLAIESLKIKLLNQCEKCLEPNTIFPVLTDTTTEQTIKAKTSTVEDNLFKEQTMEKEKLYQSQTSNSENGDSVDELGQVIKKEFGFQVKIEPMECDINIDGQCLEINTTIKGEIEIKEESFADERLDIIYKTAENKNLDNLYKNHIIVNNGLVIGPEVIQEIDSNRPNKTADNKTKDIEIDEPITELKCETCAKRFVREDELKHHTRTCSNYICDICQKGFHGDTKIIDHVVNHIKESPRMKHKKGDAHFSNQICLVFTYRNNIMTTLDECNALNICSKDLLTAQSLSDKIPCKKRHVCVLCDQCFTKKFYLKNHTQKIHSAAPLVA